MTTPKELAKVIIKSLIEHPDAWHFGDHYAKCGELQIWIANRDFADMTIGPMRLGTKWSRAVMRKLMDNLVCDRAIECIEAGHEEITPLDINAVLKKLETQ